MKSFTGLKISTLSVLAIMGPGSPVAATSPIASSPVATEENTSPSRNLHSCPPNYKEFQLTVNPDAESATENSWALMNAITNDVIDVGTISGEQDYHICLPVCGHFKFTMLDKIGDGFATAAGYKLQMDDEEMYHTPKGMAFESVSTDFHVVDRTGECPEPSTRLVHMTKQGKMCLQPDGIADDAQIVFKRCVDQRLKQRWTTDNYGRIISTYHTGPKPKCITRDADVVDSTLHLRDCPPGPEMKSSFIINDYDGLIHTMIGEKMMLLRSNMRDGSLRVRDFKPDHRNLEAFMFHVEHIFDGPGNEFPMFSHAL